MDEIIKAKCDEGVLKLQGEFCHAEKTRDDEHGNTIEVSYEHAKFKAWLEAALREVYLKGVKRGQSPDGIMLKKQGTI